MRVAALLSIITPYLELADVTIGTVPASRGEHLAYPATVVTRAVEEYFGEAANKSLVLVEMVPGDGRESADAWGRKVEAVVGCHALYRTPAMALFGLDSPAVALLDDQLAAVVDAQVSVIDGPIQTLPAHAEARLTAIRDKMLTKTTPDPFIVSMANKVDAGKLRASLEYLTGVSSTIVTRNSYSDDAIKVSHWLVHELETLGYEVEYWPYSDRYSPNVIATLPGRFDTSYVIIGGHYDSRSRNVSSPTDPAPGANDDGSGTALNLEVARVLASSPVTLNYTVRIGFWSGEEQGRRGSKAYAGRADNSGDDIIAYINSDMVAYRPPEVETMEIALLQRDSNAVLNEILMPVIALYEPHVSVCYSPVCCADQASFNRKQYPASGVFENCDWIRDPMYHKEGDILDRPGYDVDGQLTTTTRAVIAIVLTLTGFPDPSLA
ncbi:peptidase M28 [Thecamonas trahens ATCC 50062]|uniref:Peptidase M28 n=1 Tax=Thecamonas trahens ATCC 50062 TaxID=461836 RepID=A0A0L0DQD8_THETB|nr:peptidase M28 [Thecamonas trahens ATCC 50062]KNC54524.1 peptidase M28 [Thecamonas trahens ATCC 50062]|eukprot:XP_013753541.1 peptidase M28 [Thecamonas trahens ATCC 50062]